MAKTLYAKYLEEREGFSVIEDERGFASYKILGEECYIRDIYIEPEHRRSKVGSGFSDAIERIAKESGCKYLAGTVYPRSNGATESLMAILRNGFKVNSCDSEKIILVKELS